MAVMAFDPALETRLEAVRRRALDKTPRKGPLDAETIGDVQAAFEALQQAAGNQATSELVAEKRRELGRLMMLEVHKRSGAIAPDAGLEALDDPMLFHRVQQQAATEWVNRRNRGYATIEADRRTPEQRRYDEIWNTPRRYSLREGRQVQYEGEMMTRAQFEARGRFMATMEAGRNIAGNPLSGLAAATSDYEHVVERANRAAPLWGVVAGLGSGLQQRQAYEQTTRAVPRPQVVQTSRASRGGGDGSPPAGQVQRGEPRVEQSLPESPPLRLENMPLLPVPGRPTASPESRGQPRGEGRAADVRTDDAATQRKNQKGGGLDRGFKPMGKAERAATDEWIAQQKRDLKRRQDADWTDVKQELKKGTVTNPNLEPRERNTYLDFGRVPKQLRPEADAEAEMLTGHLMLPIPRNRVLDAPWVGRIYNKAGEAGSAGTSLGWERNESRFWSAFKRNFPSDYKLIGPGRTVTPELARKWGWPEDVVGQKLVHHHMANSRFTVAIPESYHKDLSELIHSTPTIK